MKILLGTENIAGWIKNYKLGFERNGYFVTTAIFNDNKFYNYSFDYQLNKIFFPKKEIKLKKHQIIKKIIRKVKNEYSYYKYKKFVKNLIDTHDVLIVIWSTFLLKSKDLEYAKKKGKKIISIFVGSDVRYFKAFKQEFDVSQWVFPTSWDHDRPEHHLQLIRNAEKYSDLIYSVPDQAGLQLRPYFHVKIPMVVDDFQFNIPENRILKVVHAPSVPFKKGTDIIEATLQRLREEGILFELISVRDIPNHELLSILSDADVLVDEIVYNGPGTLSLEAMLSGCAVATRLYQLPSKYFHPPIIDINADNIYEKLKQLLTDPVLIKKLAIEGRNYVISNNSTEKVVKNILLDLEQNRQEDYHPTFLRYDFISSSKREVRVINHWTKTVMECDWYKIAIPRGKRKGLIF